MATVVSTNSGKVKFFNGTKGYGFIIDDNDVDKDKDPMEYFFHISGTLDRVNKDDLVLFDLENGQRGIKAINIKRKKE